MKSLPSVALILNVQGDFTNYNQILLWLAKLTSFVASLLRRWEPLEKGWVPKREIGHL
jgi:hypothetical protein